MVPIASSVESPSSKSLSSSSVLLFIITAAIALSSVRALRIEVAGLLVHPYLIPLGLFMPWLGVRGLRRFPRISLILAALFVALYSFSLIPGPGMLGETVKILAAFATTVGIAGAIRSRRDYDIAIVGLCLGVGFLSLRGLVAGTAQGALGANPMDEIANKNAFSLYALPPLLLGGSLLLNSQLSKRVRWVLMSSCIVIVATIFATGNRSGWAGAVLIGMFLLMQRRKFRAWFTVGLVAMGGYYVLSEFGDTTVLEHRTQQTLEGYSSDTTRKDLFFESMEIAWENPMLGVSPRLLPRELARRLRHPGFTVDPHNVIAHVAGGSGFITLFLLIAFLWSLRAKKARVLDKSPEAIDRHQAIVLMRQLLVLWAFRGMFTREILYAPAFAAGLGLVIGYCILNNVWVRPMFKGVRLAATTGRLHNHGNRPGR